MREDIRDAEFDPFDDPPEEAAFVELRGPSMEDIKAIIEKRLEFISGRLGQTVATIDDSAVALLQERSAAHLGVILAAVCNSITYAVEVEGRSYPVTIDAALVTATLEDIDRTLSATDGEERGKLTSFMHLD